MKTKITAIFKADYSKRQKLIIFAIIAACIGLLCYVLAFIVEKPVTFSYAGETCSRQLTIAPSMHAQSDDSNFTVSYQSKLSLGSLDVLAMKSCFTPTIAPTEGMKKVRVAPFGSIIARKTFALRVASAPVASTASFRKAVPVSKPLEVPLSKADTTFSYSLRANKRQATCQDKNTAVSCDMPALELKQGKKYQVSLVRSFREASETTVAATDIKTLTAVTITKSSIKNNQTIYAKPKSFAFTTDKTLQSAEATLQTTDKKSIRIAVKTTINGKEIVVTPLKPLARQTEYRLTLTKAEARDGSTFVDPEVKKFTMSGGPKVTGINIGSSRVAGSAVATIQFDQPLSQKVDVAKYVTITGGAAIIGRQASSVTVALQALPRCQAFTLSVKPGMVSKYDIKSDRSWSFKSRTLCHTSSVYGYSVQGKPLVAYYFGTSGPTTMYVGAIHGNESSSSGLMSDWIEELENNASRIGNRRIVIVPTINPDGVAAGTRTNSRSVNLNRNFPTDNWVKDIKDTDGSHKGGGGKKPLSEPEAKALASLTTQIRPRLLLSFHAIGSLTAGDPGGYSANYARTYASMVGYRDATGSGDTFDYDITGAYEDWTYRNIGIPSMVIELGSYGYVSIQHHKAALWAML